MRMVRGLVVLLAVVGAGTPPGVTATVYLNEDFDAGRLPARWQARTSGSGRAYYSFEKRAGGYYYFASVEVRSEQYAAVELTSRELTVAPRTLYYRFDFTSYKYGTAGVGSEFRVKYVGSTNNILYKGLPSSSSWHVEAGSFFVAESKPIVAIWKISGGAAPGRYGVGSMGLDNVAIADVPNIGVAPASFGRVKALFR